MSIVVDRAIIYAEKEGYRALELDVHRPASGAAPRPLIVYVHGGGWRVSGRQRTPRETREWTPGFFDRVVEAGFVVAAPDYRFSGEALYPAAVDDVKDALAWLRAHAAEFGADAGRIAVWGQSAGGFNAASVALAPDSWPLRAAVCWYPLTDFPSLDHDDPASFPALFLGGPIGSRLQLARRASPTSRARPGAPPFLLVHGTDDMMAPYSQSVLLRDALVSAGVPVELHTIDGADHFFARAPDVEAIFDHTIAFLRATTAS